MGRSMCQKRQVPCFLNVGRTLLRVGFFVSLCSLGQAFVWMPSVMNALLQPHHIHTINHDPATGMSSTEYVSLALKPLRSRLQPTGLAMMHKKNQHIGRDRLIGQRPKTEGAFPGKTFDKFKSRSSSPQSASASTIKKSSPKPFHQPNKPPRKPRLQDDTTEVIPCEHFGACSGCVANTYQTMLTVPSLEATKKYFNSPFVQSKIIDAHYKKHKPPVQDPADLRRKNNNAIVDFYKIAIPKQPTKWRTQARLVVTPKPSSYAGANKSPSSTIRKPRGKDTSFWSRDGCRFGLYQRRSHHILDIPRCQVHHPAINEAVKLLEEATKQVGTSPYSEFSHDGDLRTVQLTVEQATGKVSCVFVWNTPGPRQAQQPISLLCKALKEKNPGLWHSFWLHCNDKVSERTFTSKDRNWYKIWGEEFQQEPIRVNSEDDTPVGYFHFSPMVFRQANLDEYNALAKDVARAVPGGSKVCELYSGVGVLGLTTLVQNALSGTPLEWLRCNDDSAVNARCFRRSLKSLPDSITEYPQSSSSDNDFDDNLGSEEPLTLGEFSEMLAKGDTELPFQEEERKGSRVHYRVLDAPAALERGRALGASVMIVNPPSKGMDEGVLDELCKPLNPQQPYAEYAEALVIPDEEVNWTNDVTKLIFLCSGTEALERDCNRLLAGKGGWKLVRAKGYVLFPGSDYVETLCVFRRKPVQWKAQPATEEQEDVELSED